MTLVGTNIRTMTYIRSEAEFNRARLAGFWDVIGCLILGRYAHLLPFDEVIEGLPIQQTIDLGLQDIPLNAIIGSVERGREFSRHFWPRSGNRNSKERWRELYTLAVTGVGAPPVELYKVGQVYFVRDGHHRVSVAKHLGWATIQAHVVEMVIPPRMKMWREIRD
jgi:hypothetical protein